RAARVLIRIVPTFPGPWELPPIGRGPAEPRRFLAVYKPAMGAPVPAAERHAVIGLGSVIGGDRQRLRVHRQRTSVIEGETVVAARSKRALGSDDGGDPCISGRGRTCRE